MNYKLYSVYDKVSGLFSPPFTAVNDGSAVRTFRYSMQQSDQRAASADDYRLYCVGAFDDVSGEVDSVLISAICEGREVVKDVSDAV